MAPLVRIICDGGGALGFGNLRRSATLGRGFVRAGYRVRVEPVSDAAHALLPYAPNDPGEADLWMLDLPYDGDQWVAGARGAGKQVAALDYQGDAAPDLIISIFPRGTARSAKRHLVGLEYAIIRPDVAALAPAREGAGVVVVIGGGDCDGLGVATARALYKAGEAVTLVEGPLAETAGALPSGILRLSSPPDIASRMAGCAWGVTSGGGAMLEMLCLGKAVHAIPRTPHEAALARLILKHGALLGVGLDALRPPEPVVRARVAEAARALVDGRGVERIVEAGGTLL